VATDRKIASNQKNAQKSTGPRSEAGRRRSSRNALRHGLAVAIGSQSCFSKDIEALAKVLSAKSRRPTEFARQAAEAEMDLLRIRKIRASLFEAIIGNPNTPHGAHSELDENLAKLERYERRAFSRRKRALRVLTA
jgi:hypothetical protein